MISNCREETTKEYDFREMAKVTETMKRLQAGPRAKKQKEDLQYPDKISDKDTRDDARDPDGESRQKTRQALTDGK